MICWITLGKDHAKYIKFLISFIWGKSCTSPQKLHRTLSRYWHSVPLHSRIQNVPLYSLRTKMHQNPIHKHLHPKFINKTLRKTFPVLTVSPAVFPGKKKTKKTFILMWSHSFCDIYGICVEYGPEDDWINGSSCSLLLIIGSLLFFSQWKTVKKEMGKG